MYEEYLKVLFKEDGRRGRHKNLIIRKPLYKHPSYFFMFVRED
jgi:hypothetical protein